MGMFGNKKNLLPQDTVAGLMRDLPIGVGGAAATPGIGDDLPGANPMGGMTRAPMVLGAGEAPRQKFGTWEAIGTLGDALQAIGGGQGTYLPMVLGERQQQQQLARQQAMRAQERAADNEDWQRRFDYTQANKAPTPNDTVADYEFWRSKLTPEQFAQWVQNRVNPPSYQIVNGQLVRIGTPSAAPTAPVGKLTPIGGR